MDQKSSFTMDQKDIEKAKRTKLIKHIYINLSNYIFPGGTGGRLIGGGFSQAKFLLEGGDCGNS